MLPGHEPRSALASSQSSGSALTPSFLTSVRALCSLRNLEIGLPEYFSASAEERQFLLLTRKEGHYPPTGDVTQFAREPTKAQSAALRHFVHTTLPTGSLPVSTGRERFWPAARLLLSPVGSRS